MIMMIIALSAFNKEIYGCVLCALEHFINFARKCLLINFLEKKFANTVIPKYKKYVQYVTPTSSTTNNQISIKESLPQTNQYQSTPPPPKLSSSISTVVTVTARSISPASISPTSSSTLKTTSLKAHKIICAHIAYTTSQLLKQLHLKDFYINRYKFNTTSLMLFSNHQSIASGSARTISSNYENKAN
jgi:hypothetical protein